METDSSDFLLDSPSNTLPLPVDTDNLVRSSRLAASSQTVIPDRFQSQGLAEIARYGGYSVFNAVSNTDPFVRTSLKTFSREIYERIYGYTRRPEGTLGMYSALLKFSVGEKREYDGLTPQQKQAMNSSIAKARAAFRLPTKYEPLDWHEVGQHMRTDTSAGVTFPGFKKGEVMDGIYRHARWLGHRLKYSGTTFDPRRVRFPPCMAGQRGGMSERDAPKTRLVWIYPAEILTIEGFYAPTLIREFMRLPDSPMLVGKSSQRLYTQWLCGLKDGETLYGLDFSAFDTTIPAWLIRVAFDILRQNIDWEHFRGVPVSKEEAQKWRNVWDGMVWYFINTPMLMPDGRMFRKYRGVPSGSWFTQLIDSVVNYIVVDYLTTCQEVEIRKLKVLGDDSAFRSGHEFDLVVASQDAGAVGMVLHPEKCEKTVDPTEFKLLGTTYRNGRAHRPPDEWFKLALYPENSVPDIGVSLTRMVGLWLGGAMFDQEFVRFMTYFQTCFETPCEGWFSKDTRRWLEIVYSGKAPRGWSTKNSLFWRSIFYVF